MDTDKHTSLHENLCAIIAEALTSAESGGNPNLAIEIRRHGVTVERFYDTPQATKEHFPFGDPDFAEVAQAADAPRELVLGNMVEVRHGDGFLPNPGKIVSLTTSLVEEPQYLVEYWLQGDPKSVWLRAGYLRFYAEDGDAAKQREIEDDAAAALRHDVRQKANEAGRQKSADTVMAAQTDALRERLARQFGDEGSFITTIATGECLSGFSLVDNVAAAACAHGMSGTLTIYFNKNEVTAAEAPSQSDAEDIARP